MSRDSKQVTADGIDVDGTRTLTEPGPGSAVTPPPSSGSLDGARFVPGTVLAGRYRIVGLLGRGGMGEVYRAEDLKLGEPVALKFLPAELTLDGAALARFHREVRVARNVAHRNVCRVFDIGEAGGLHFLSMEYIDGEDLSGLLKRIGRLPRDKAVELARQICAGLGAAHEAGVLHRDMKPANVMIDGKGRAKITDFGLAQVADELKDKAAFAGTPAYMAPEQITAGEVSVKTDLYALGLVLYEMFTGKRAFADEDWRDLMERGGHGGRPEGALRQLSRPSSHVEGLDPLVERVVMRCLEEDPSARPSSALEVSAALPGGDPLAAALAAGETPSPEMVAAAPAKGTLKPLMAAGCLAALLILLLAWVPLAERSTFLGITDVGKSPEVLADRAASLVAKLSATETGAEGADSGSIYRAHGLGINYGYMRHIRESGRASERWRVLRTSPPAALYFWYRRSPEPLYAWNLFLAPGRDNPPLLVPGMATVELDPSGRLRAWRAYPTAVEEPSALSAGANSPAIDEPGAEPWAELFAEAELDPAKFTAAEPRWVPPFHTDQRASWQGTWPGRSDLPIRIEAAAYRGRPMWFEIVEPWDELRERRGSASFRPILLGLILPGFLLTVTGGLWLARRNLRSGRGDRRGATRLALFSASCTLLSWLLAAHHTVSLGEVWSFVGGLAEALLHAAYFWVVYLALEPFLRRRWPEGMISWSRLLAGNLRDPLVGRDVLVGGLIGTACLVARQLGQRVDVSDNVWLWNLLDLRRAAANLTSTHVFVPLSEGFIVVFVFLGLYVLLRRKQVAALALLVILSVLFPPLARVSELPVSLLVSALSVIALVRFGFLAFVANRLFFFLLLQFPMTTDFSVWFADRTVFALALAAALGIWGFRTASAGQPLFGRRPASQL